MVRIEAQEKSNANQGALKKNKKTKTYRLDSDPALYRNIEGASERGSHNSATLSRNAPSRIASLSGRYRRSLLAGRALRNEGPFWMCRAAEKRRVVRREQSQHLSPSDPALAPTSLMAGPGMWPLIAGGRQHQRKAQSGQRLYIANVPRTSMHCMSTCVHMERRRDKQNR